MAEFFHLNKQDIVEPANAEDKVISREQRIFADNVIFANGDTYTVKTTSKAYRQKLKFFVDVVEYTDPDTEQTFKYRCGYYYECEHYESVRLFTSLGFMSFYFVIDRIFDGQYDFSFYISNENVKLYVSSVVFEDSFYNPEKGWLNPNNPDNIIDELEDDDDPNIPTIPGYTGGGGMTPYFVATLPLSSESDAVRTVYEDEFVVLTHKGPSLPTKSANYIAEVNIDFKDDYQPIAAGIEYGSYWLHSEVSANITKQIACTATGFTISAGSNAHGFLYAVDMAWKAKDGYIYSMTVNYVPTGINQGGSYQSVGFSIVAYFKGRSPIDKTKPF